MQTAQPTGNSPSRFSAALDGVGLVGHQLRSDLIRDFNAKIVLRDGQDAVEIIGAAGTGKHTVAAAAHAVARNVLGRTGEMRAFDCGALASDMSRNGGQLASALHNAAGGTLVLDGFGRLDGLGRRTVNRAIRHNRGEAMVLALSNDATGSDVVPATATAIRLKPLHERQDDVWELVDHFYTTTRADHAGAPGVDRCRGFSRQAKGDIAEVVRETGLQSVRKLRNIVRDVFFENLADGDMPLKLTSEQVRPYLERTFGQTEQGRVERDAELLNSRFDALVDPSLLERLADLHGVPGSVLMQQAELIKQVIDSIDDVPRSYRNVMTRLEDVQRAALWLMTGADTQAAFRRFYGDEGFMRPTKSVAWAFYNRVFKRDM